VREKRSCTFCLWKYVIFHGQKAFFLGFFMDFGDFWIRGNLDWDYFMMGLFYDGIIL